jgi:hypothetical protein
MSRDRKSRKKPYRIDDFYCFNDPDNTKDSISGQYGAAAQALITLNEFPAWGLFVYKELMENATDADVPELLCFKSSDAIILAPTIDIFSCTGMLIALESASMKTMSMVSPCNKHIRVKMPKIGSKVIAIENCVIDIIN